MSWSGCQGGFCCGILPTVVPLNRRTIKVIVWENNTTRWTYWTNTWSVQIRGEHLKRLISALMHWSYSAHIWQEMKSNLIVFFPFTAFRQSKLQLMCTRAWTKRIVHREVSPRVFASCLDVSKRIPLALPSQTKPNTISLINIEWMGH